MRTAGRIITIGLSPAWDITCRVSGLDWGEHRTIDGMTRVPAGKALNISRALAWMNHRSIAAGLWGQDDFDDMRRAMRPLRELIAVHMTPAAGATRQNITVVDALRNRDMHLRSKSTLVTAASLSRLARTLDTFVNKESICVFAGALPQDGLLNDVQALVRRCLRRGARIVIDTSGQPLKRLARTGGLWLIKPNIEELGEILGQPVPNTTRRIVQAAKRLLPMAELVLVSRGEKGAIAVDKDGAWSAVIAGRRHSIHATVGCGDYLLAGFLYGIIDGQPVSAALSAAIKVAAARAWGWCSTKTWRQAKHAARVNVARLWRAERCIE